MPAKKETQNDGDKAADTKVEAADNTVDTKPSAADIPAEPKPSAADNTAEPKFSAADNTVDTKQKPVMDASSILELLEIKTNEINDLKGKLNQFTDFDKTLNDVNKSLKLYKNFAKTQLEAALEKNETAKEIINIADYADDPLSGLDALYKYQQLEKQISDRIKKQMGVDAAAGPGVAAPEHIDVTKPGASRQIFLDLVRSGGPKIEN